MGDIYKRSPRPIVSRFFFRRFIKDYSSIASPLNKLTEKGVAYHWSIECNHAFRALKKCLTTAQLVVTPRIGPNEYFVISPDASNKGTGAVLFQEQPDGTLRPCSYYGKTLNNAQRIYPLYDRELLAIAAALNEYRIYSEGCASFAVLTDHRLVTHLPTQMRLGRRHVLWGSVVSQYMGYMNIVYRKGSENDSDMRLVDERISRIQWRKASMITPFSKRNLKNMMGDCLKTLRNREIV